MGPSKGPGSNTPKERSGVITPDKNKDRARKPYGPYGRWASQLKRADADKKKYRSSALNIRNSVNDLTRNSSVRSTIKRLKSASAMMNLDNVFGKGKKGGRRSRKQRGTRRAKRTPRK
jgi:hypothetical protein